MGIPTRFKALLFSLSSVVIPFLGSQAMAAVPPWMAQPGLEGHYAGTMDLTFERARKVNLELTLATTGESEFIQKGPNKFEERKVIDSAFIVDDEGGPYTFTHVTFNLDQSQLDLRYNRRQQTLGRGASDMRLIGNFDDKGNLKGRVLSGNKGPIGTFSLAPVEKKGLEIKKKYDGAYVGTATLFPRGGRRSFDVVISNGLAEVNNPPDFELGFTPGKMAYFAFDGIKFNFNQIAINYLQQRLILTQLDSQGKNMVTAELDAESGEDGLILRGSLYGIYKGKSADIGMRKVY